MLSKSTFNDVPDCSTSTWCEEEKDAWYRSEFDPKLLTVSMSSNIAWSQSSVSMIECSDPNWEVFCVQRGNDVAWGIFMDWWRSMLRTRKEAWLMLWCSVLIFKASVSTLHIYALKRCYATMYLTICLSMKKGKTAHKNWCTGHALTSLECICDKAEGCQTAI